MAKTIHTIITNINHFVENCEHFLNRSKAKAHYRRQIKSHFKNISTEDLEEAERIGIIEGKFSTVNWIKADLDKI